MVDVNNKVNLPFGEVSIQGYSKGDEKNITIGNIGDNSLVQIGNDNTHTIVNNFATKQDAQSRADALDQLIGRFTEKSAEYLVTQIKNPLRHPNQKDCSDLKKFIEEKFKAVVVDLNDPYAKEFLQLKHRACNVLRKFIESHDQAAFVPEWIAIGKELMEYNDSGI